MKSAFIVLITLSICLLSHDISAQDVRSEQQAIQQLVDKRQAKFGSYAAAAESKTGFFGGKSKADLRKQIDILREIIKTDNQIISLLNNFLDYRSFQKTELVFDQGKLEAEKQRLDELTTVLSKNLEAANAVTSQLESQLRWSRLINLLMAVVVLFLVIKLVRRKDDNAPTAA